MAKEQIAITAITGKTREEVAFDLVTFPIQHPGVFKGKLTFNDYKEFLEEYKRALRAISSPATKGTDV